MKKGLIIEFREGKASSFGKTETYFVSPGKTRFVQIFSSDDQGRIHVNGLNEAYFEICKNGYDICYATVEHFDFEKFDKMKDLVKFIKDNFEKFTKEEKQILNYLGTELKK